MHCSLKITNKGTSFLCFPLYCLSILHYFFQVTLYYIFYVPPKSSSHVTFDFNMVKSSTVVFWVVTNILEELMTSTFNSED